MLTDKDLFNKVEGITAVCVSNTTFFGESYDSLEVGKTYEVEYISVLRSSSSIKIIGGERRYSSGCFNFYENGKDMGNFGQDPRFLAPYLRPVFLGMIFEPRWKEIKNMEENAIIPCLKKIEQEYDVRILLAVESGSRAWGFASKDSDWDVRIIYVHKPEWYLQVNDQKDTIEYYDPETDIDLSGWDLKKALTLFRKSNPSMMEWLHSPVVYYEDKDFTDKMLELEECYFNPISTMYHYHSIYMKHNERYLSKNGVTLKRFLYYLRGILACKWLETNSTLPPVDFWELMESTVDDPELQNLIIDLLWRKSISKESDEEEVDKKLVKFGKELALYYTGLVDKYRPDMDLEKDYKPLNELMVNLVLNRK